MKKFYAIAASLLTVGSMMASHPAVVTEANQQAKMSEEGMAMLRAEQAFADYASENNVNIPGSQKFNWTDNTGTEWVGSMYESGSWADSFTEWEGAAYYAKVIVNIRNIASSQDNLKRINYVTFYPKYNCIKAEYQSQFFPGADLTNPDRAVDPKYWDNPESLPSIWKGFAVPQASTTPGSFYIGETEIGADSYFVICNSCTPSSAGKPYFAATTSMGYATYNGAPCGPKQGSKLTMSNFDNETSSINLHFTGSAQNEAGSTVWTYDLNFSGEAFMPGFSSLPMQWEATNVHIVNTGSVKGTDEAYGAIDDTNWGPFQRFFVLACGEGFSWDNVELWSADTYPTEQPVRISQGTDLTFLRGALFSANGATEPNNIWHASEMKVGFDGNFPITENKPAENTFLYGNVNSNYWPWGESDGMYSVYNGMYWWLNNKNYQPGAEFNPFLMNGTTAGFGYRGLSTFNAIYKVSYKGNVIYHYDPTDYTKTRVIPSIGALEPEANWDAVETVFVDGDNNINVNAANGIINVNVANAANVAIYNLAGVIVKNVKAAAGETVSVNVGNGIYIVKAGNKAVKVAL